MNPPIYPNQPVFFFIALSKGKGTSVRGGKGNTLQGTRKHIPPNGKEKENHRLKRQPKNVSYQEGKGFTSLKFNSSPLKKWWLEDNFSFLLGQTAYFQGRTVGFTEGKDLRVLGFYGFIWFQANPFQKNSRPKENALYAGMMVVNPFLLLAPGVIGMVKRYP